MRTLSELESRYLEAARNGDLEGVKAALNEGVNPNVQAKDWSTAILLAARGKHYDLVSFLAERDDVDINLQDQKSFNPFIHGCINNDLHLVKLMVAAGCELERLTRFGGNGLTPCAEKGHLELVTYLTTETDINVNHTNTLGWTALIEAVILNDGGATPQAVVRQLLEAGADPRMTDEYGVLPVDLAERKGYTELAAIIREYM